MSENSETLHAQFLDEPDMSRMTPEERKLFEHDLLWKVFIDHHAVKDDVIDTMRSASFDRDNVFASEDIFRMLQSLRCEKNVEISNEVEAEIEEAIKAYKEEQECFPIDAYEYFC